MRMEKIVSRSTKRVDETPLEKKTSSRCFRSTSDQAFSGQNDFRIFRSIRRVGGQRMSDPGVGACVLVAVQGSLGSGRAASFASPQTLPRDRSKRGPGCVMGLFVAAEGGAPKRAGSGWVMKRRAHVPDTADFVFSTASPSFAEARARKELEVRICLFLFFPGTRASAGAIAERAPRDSMFVVRADEWRQRRRNPPFLGYPDDKKRTSFD